MSLASEHCSPTTRRRSGQTWLNVAHAHARRDPRHPGRACEAAWPLIRDGLRAVDERDRLDRAWAAQKDRRESQERVHERSRRSRSESVIASFAPTLPTRAPMSAPTRLQSHATSCLCLALSLTFAPISFTIALGAWLRALWQGSLLSRRGRNGQDHGANGRKPVLINGARATKALAMARAWKKAGHRVILCVALLLPCD